MISPSDWSAYKSVIREAHDDFNQQVIIWRRLVASLDRRGEGQNNAIIDTSIKVLILSNYERTWPISRWTESGLIDDQSLVIIINKEYAEENGWVNDSGYFNMDVAGDRFNINGVWYKPAGESEVSQAHDEPLLFYIILRKSERNTGDKVYAKRG